MLKKLFYIVIYCLCASSTKAQQRVQHKEQVIKYLTVINDNIKSIKDNLSQPCKSIFEKSFRKVDTTKIGRKTLEELLKMSRQIANDYKNPGDTCSNDTIREISNSTQQLIRKLKTLIRQVEDSAKKKPFQLTIKVLDDSTNIALNAKVSIVLIGMADTLRIAPVKLKGTSILFHALLLPRKNYLITVSDTLYSQQVKELNIFRDSTIAIKLRRITRSLEKDKTAFSKEKKERTPSIDSQSFIDKHIFLFIRIGLLFFLTLIGSILYIKTLVHRRVQSKREDVQSDLKSISKPEEDIKTEDGTTTTTDNSNLSLAECSVPEIDKVQADSPIGQMEKDQFEVLPIKNGEVVGPNSLSRTFNCEIMMTAGPRKKFMNEPNADRDLGEDVCGFVASTSNVLIWVLDGTSDLHCLRNPLNKREYFSSRLLAQLLAERMRNGFSERSENGFDEIVLKAIQEVKEDFLIQINQLPAEEIILLKKNIEDKNFPECATTILIARLSLNGDFTAYRSGDSKMFLFTGSPNNELRLVETFLEAKNEKSNDRLFFRLMLNEEGKFNIFFNRPDNEIIDEKNINTIISFSDGVGLNTERFLREEYRKSPVQVRREIVYQLQGTGDDKSLCFIEIKET